MTLYINEVTQYDYLFCSRLSLPPLGAYCVRHSLTRKGVILEACTEDGIVGMAVLEAIPRPRLTYVYVEEKFREKGIGTELVKAALTSAEGKNAVEVESCVILQNEYGETADCMLRKAGFSVLDTATVIRGINDERCNRAWTAFMMEKGKRISDILIKRGFQTLQFNEVSPQTLDRLKVSIGTEFVSKLDPFFYISNPNDRLVPEYSFITLKNHEPVAFVTVTTVDGKTLVFKQLSAALRYQGKGVFLLPFAAFMERFLTGETYSKISAVISDRNDKMQALLHGFVGSLVDSKKTQNIYRYKL